MKLTLLILLFCTTLFANIGKISAVNGQANLIRDTQSIPIQLGTILEEKDIVKTGDNGRLQIIFSDKTIISLGKNSDFNIEEYLFDESRPKEVKASFNAPKGIFKTITGQIGKLNPSKFKLRTKSASIGIRGTVYYVTAIPNQPPVIACTKGIITIETTTGEKVDIPAGYYVKIEPGKPITVAPIPQEQKEQLDQNSGATQNEQESGQNEQTPTDNTPQPTTQQQTENTTLETAIGTVKVVTKETQEDEGNEEDDDEENVFTSSVTSSSDTASSAGDSSDTDSSTSSGDTGDTGDTTTNLKTATYDVFSTGTLEPYDGVTNGFIDAYSYSEKQIAPATFAANDGILSGLLTFNKEDYQGTISSTNTALNIDNRDLGEYQDTYEGFKKVDEQTSDTGAVTSIYAESMHEFFLQETELTINDTIDYEYSLFSVIGLKSDMIALPTDGISYYFEPLDGMSVGDTSADIDTSDILATAGTYTRASTFGTYVNWKAGNSLSYEIENNRLNIIIGKIEEDASGKANIKVNYYERTTDFTKELDSTSSDMYFFGSEYQGWGGNLAVENESGWKLSYTHGEFRMADYSGEYDETIANSTPTGITELYGFANTLSDPEELYIYLDRSSMISGYIQDPDPANGIKFEGDLGVNSAYITDDTFAVLGFSGEYSGDGTVSDGWLIAVDSGSVYDDGSDDKISWGLWGMEYDDSGSDTSIGFQAWVAGQDQVTNISSMVSEFAAAGITSATYQGQIMGCLNSTTLIDPTKSTIDLSFDFSANTLGADISINNSAVTMSQTFISSDGVTLNSNMDEFYSASNGSAEIKGSFHDNGATTIGSFYFQNGTDTALGVYKAAKQ